MKKLKKFRNALFVGRFQPFHDGHLKVIRDIARESEKLTIIIAGPSKPDARNPFSFAERKRMVGLALAGMAGKYDVFGISDVNDDKKWGEAVRRLDPFDVAYSRNPWTTRCLKRIGIAVAKHKFYARYKNCGRVIRQRILDHMSWHTLVPPRVYAYIRQINGEERIRKSM